MNVYSCRGPWLARCIAAYASTTFFLDFLQGLSILLSHRLLPFWKRMTNGSANGWFIGWCTPRSWWFRGYSVSTQSSNFAIFMLISQIEWTLRIPVPFYTDVVLTKIPFYPLFNALLLIALMHYPVGGTSHSINFMQYASSSLLAPNRHDLSRGRRKHLQFIIYELQVTRPWRNTCTLNTSHLTWAKRR